MILPLLAILAADPMYDAGKHVAAGAACQFLGQATIRYYGQFTNEEPITPKRGNIAAAASCMFLFLMQEMAESQLNRTAMDWNHLLYDGAGVAPIALTLSWEFEE